MEGRYDRLARSIATLVNILDVIVLGGRLSDIDTLYEELPPQVEGQVKIVKNQHGDSSGAAGAAWLCGKEEAKKGLPRP